MTFAPIKGQCPVCRQDAGLNLDPIVSFSESKQLAELRAENDSLKEVISLSEDSRLMDEYLKLERANARQAERIKANEQYEQALKGDCRKQVADLRANIAAQAAVIKRERTARKTAQESLENYKGECTQLYHDVDRLSGENQQQAARIKALEAELSLIKPNSDCDSGCMLSCSMEGKANAATIERQRKVVKLSEQALTEVQDLIAESRGVYGLHLNGDKSPWNEIEQGGWFERLVTLPEALAAIAELEQGVG